MGSGRTGRIASAYVLSISLTSTPENVPTSTATSCNNARKKNNKHQFTYYLTLFLTTTNYDDDNDDYHYSAQHQYHQWRRHTTTNNTKNTTRDQGNQCHCDIGIHGTMELRVRLTMDCNRRLIAQTSKPDYAEHKRIVSIISLGNSSCNVLLVRTNSHERTCKILPSPFLRKTINPA